MHIDFGKLSIQVHNWPEGIKLPPIRVDNIAARLLGTAEDMEDCRSSKRSFRSLPIQDLYILGIALRNAEHPLHFRIYTDGLPTGNFIVI